MSTVVAIEKKKKTIGQTSFYTHEIVKYLQRVEEGSIAQYDEIGQSIGMNVRPNKLGYGYLQSAFKILERDHNIIYENIPKVGYKRLTVEEVAQTGLTLYTKRKKANIQRHKRRINTVSDNYEDLSDQDKMKVTATRTILAFDEQTTKRASLVEDKVQDTRKMIGFNDTIKLFEK